MTEMKKQVNAIHNYKIKNTMPVKNSATKGNPYVYTEADLGEGLLHAGVSHLYWIGKEVNEKINAIAVSSKLIRPNNGQNNFCY
jgi:hypothetical protein